MSCHRSLTLFNLVPVQLLANARVTSEEGWVDCVRMSH